MLLFGFAIEYKRNASAMKSTLVASSSGCIVAVGRSDTQWSQNRLAEDSVDGSDSLDATLMLSFTKSDYDVVTCGSLLFGLVGVPS